MSSAKTLVVSFVGMRAQEIGVKSNLKIFMESDNQMLEEVMVVAYGTAKNLHLQDLRLFSNLKRSVKYRHQMP